MNRAVPPSKFVSLSPCPSLSPSPRLAPTDARKAFEPAPTIYLELSHAQLIARPVSSACTH